MAQVQLPASHQRGARSIPDQSACMSCFFVDKVALGHVSLRVLKVFL